MEQVVFVDRDGTIIVERGTGRSTRWRSWSLYPA